MQSIYRLAKAQLSDATLGGVGRIARATRPASSIFHDRLKRTIAARQVYTNKQKKTSPRPGMGSPRIRVSLSQSTSVSSRTSQPWGSVASPHGLNTQTSPSVREIDHIPSDHVDPHSDEESESIARRPTARPGKKLSIKNSDRVFGSSRRNFRGYQPCYRDSTMLNSTRNVSRR